MIVTRALNYIHLIFLFAPFFLLFINTKYLIKYSYILKYLFLIYLLTPFTGNSLMIGVYLLF